MVVYFTNFNQINRRGELIFMNSRTNVMAKVIEFYVGDLFPKKAKSVPRDRCGEVIQSPKDKADVASSTPNIPECDGGNPFAALVMDVS
jgi:hypothetical protein